MECGCDYDENTSAILSLCMGHRLAMTANGLDCEGHSAEIARLTDERDTSQRESAILRSQIAGLRRERKASRDDIDQERAWVDVYKDEIASLTRERDEAASRWQSDLDKQRQYTQAVMQERDEALELVGAIRDAEMQVILERDKAQSQLATLAEAADVLEAMHQMATEGGWEWAIKKAEKAYWGDLEDKTERQWNRAFLRARAIHEGYKDVDERRIALAAIEPKGEQG